MGSNWKPGWIPGAPKCRLWRSILQQESRGSIILGLYCLYSLFWGIGPFFGHFRGPGGLHRTATCASSGGFVIPGASDGLSGWDCTYLQGPRRPAILAV